MSREWGDLLELFYLGSIIIRDAIFVWEEILPVIELDHQENTCRVTTSRESRNSH